MKLALIAPAVVVVVAIGLGVAGVLPIPGLSRKPKVPLAQYGLDGDKELPKVTAQPASQTPSTPPASPKAPAARLAQQEPKDSAKDPEQGADALATVWNAVKIPELISITKDWNDVDLVKVLAHMDTDNVAKFLEEMANAGNGGKPDPARASRLSKVLRDQTSVVDAGKKAGKTT